MDLKKGLSLTAFGFLFTLVNFNLIFNGTKINIIPDCLGWLLFFLAFGSLGAYAKGYKWLRWIALILAVITAAFWVLEIVRPELAASSDFSLVNTAVGVCELVFTVLIFTPLIRISKDYGSTREGTLKTLRIIDVVAYILVLAAGIYVYMTANGATSIDGMSGTTVLAGIITVIAAVAMLVCAIITVITVFGLRKEVTGKTA